VLERLRQRGAMLIEPSLEGAAGIELQSVERPAGAAYRDALRA